MKSIIYILVFSLSVISTNIYAGLIKQVSFKKINDDLISINYTNTKQAVIPEISGFNTNNEISLQELKAWYKCHDFSIIKSRAKSKAKGIQATGEWRSFLKKASAPSQKTSVFIAYDSSNLYLTAICHESNMDKLLIEPSGKRDSAVFGADCLEVFLQPSSSGNRYYHLIVDSAATIFDAFYTVHNQKRTICKSWNPNIKIKTFKTSTFWQVQLAIPFVALNVEAVQGQTLLMNICRHETPNKEYSSWGQVEKSFHEKQSFYKIFLGIKKNHPAFISQIQYTQPLLEQSFVVELKNQSKKIFKGSLELTGKHKGKSFLLKKCAVNIHPQASINSKFKCFNLPDSGEWQIRLAEKEKVIDSRTISFSRFPPLQLKLENTNLQSNSTPVRCNVTVNIPSDSLENYKLKFQLEKNNKVLSSAQISNMRQRYTNVKLDISQLNTLGTFSIKCSLLDSSKKAIYSQKKQFSISENLLDF